MGLVVPDFDWFRKNGYEGKSDGEIAKDSNARKLLKEEFDRIGKEKGLKGFEKPKDFFVHDEEFSVEQDLMTPTHKKKRHQIRQ